MKPCLEILPKAQLNLWPDLSAVPKEFILYGGTAIALQLGHRKSVDFDFFSALPLNKDQIFSSLPFLKMSQAVQPDVNTLDIIYETEEGFVKFQFLAGFGKRQARVAPILICEDNQLQVASLRDLFATKLNTIQSRAEIKDYFDIDALLLNNFDLAEALGSAKAIFGPTFDPGTSLRALCSFRDGDLPELDKKIQQRLIKAAAAVKAIPIINPISLTI